MYTDRKTHKYFIVIIALVLILALAGIVTFLRPDDEVDEEGLKAIKSAVMRSALQCYVVEGVYPSDLQYLIDNYGLTVNTEDYYITYDVFGENVPPNVIVTYRKK